MPVWFNGWCRQGCLHVARRRISDHREYRTQRNPLGIHPMLFQAAHSARKDRGCRSLSSSLSRSGRSPLSPVDHARHGERASGGGCCPNDEIASSPSAVREDSRRRQFACASEEGAEQALGVRCAADPLQLRPSKSGNLIFSVPSTEHSSSLLKLAPLRLFAGRDFSRTSLDNVSAGRPCLEYGLQHAPGPCPCTRRPTVRPANRRRPRIRRSLHRDRASRSPGRIRFPPALVSFSGRDETVQEVAPLFHEAAQSAMLRILAGLVAGVEIGRRSSSNALRAAASPIRFDGRPVPGQRRASKRRGGESS